MTFIAGQRQAAPWSAHHWWGIWSTASQLPNVAGSTAQYNADLQEGDLAWVQDVGQLYVCSDPTPTAAIWIQVSAGGGGITQLTQDVLAGPGVGALPATVVGLQTRPVSPGAPSTGDALVWDGIQWAPGTANAVTPEFEWNLNGRLRPYNPQGATFNGMATNNPALSGPGPFDGQRLVRRAGTIALIGFFVRVPANNPGGTTTIEFYRMRAGIVTSLGVAGLFTNAPNTFTGVLMVPAVSDLQAGDLLFVSLAAQAPVGAADLSAFITVTP